MNTYTRMYTYAHNAHMQHIHMHMHTQAHRQEVWQGGASINRDCRTVGEGGRGASHLAKYESGGWGGGRGPPRNQASNEGD